MNSILHCWAPQGAKYSLPSPRPGGRNKTRPSPSLWQLSFDGRLQILRLRLLKQVGVRQQEGTEDLKTGRKKGIYISG